jgi:hypothetical protein
LSARLRVPGNTKTIRVVCNVPFMHLTRLTIEKIFGS